MKAYLALISAAALALAACSQEQPAAPTAEAPASAASEAAASAAPEAASEAPAASQEEAAAPAADVSCEAVVESDDAMKFNTSEIAVSQSCKEFKITLKHVGSAPVTAMGHNIVVSKAADAQGVIADGMTAGAASNYVKEGDERVLAFTKLIGGGEETSLTLDTSKLAADGAYEFYCTFPGHYGLMKGSLKVGA